VRDALERLGPLWDELFLGAQARLVRLLVERVEVGPAGADIQLRVEGLASLVRDLGASGAELARSRGMSASASITIRVPLAVRRRPDRKTNALPEAWLGAAPPPTRGDPALVKALARAFRWERMLDEGRYASIGEMAATERVDRGHVGTVLRLTLLAPEIVEATLDGREPRAITSPALLNLFPVEWSAQATVASSPDP